MPDRMGLVAACVVGLGVFALRLGVHRRSSGTWAITLLRRRGAGALETALGASWLLLVLGVPAWVALYAWRGPESVGVVPAGEAARAAGWLLLLAGGALVAIAQAQMGTSWRVGIDDRHTALVTSGVFGLVRNPIYAGMVAALAGGALVAPSVLGVLVTAVTAAGVALQARFEERHLLALHGDAYRDYARRVGRFVPGTGRLAAREPAVSAPGSR